MPTASAVIIGNEILTAKFADLNGPWLIERCRTLGLDMVQVSIIQDTIDAISDEVRRLASRSDWVFTSGGVGPTHDDVTLRGVAAAFNVELVRNPELVDLIQKHMGQATNEAALKMADLPEGSVLWKESRKRFPVVVCRNVIIFPGVPEYLQAKFDDIAPRLGGNPVMNAQIRTHLRESIIADTLSEADQTWPSVSIGSYPRFDSEPASVIVTLDSRDKQDLQACGQWLESALTSLSHQERESPEK